MGEGCGEKTTTNTTKIQEGTVRLATFADWLGTKL